MADIPRRISVRLAWATLILAAAPGCGSVKQTGTARTGTEQLLLTNAWDRALQKVDFRPLTGVPAYLDTTNVAAVDQGWVVSSLREALLTNGVLLRQKPEQAQFIVEARVGAYGTDDYNWMMGVPQVSVPPTFTGIPTGTIPEMPIVKKTDQHGKVKLALFAYEKASGQLVWKSGTQVETSSATDRYIAGFGPIRSGSIHDGTEIDGIKVPIGGDPEATGRGRWWRRRKSVGGTPPAGDPSPPGTDLAPMAVKADRDSFRP